MFDEPTDSVAVIAAQDVPRNGILVFDGLFLHRPELVDYWDVSVFLSAESRRERVWRDYLERDLPAAPHDRAAEIARRVVATRRSRYVDGQAIYERDADPTGRATFVIDNDDFAAPRISSAR